MVLRVAILLLLELCSVEERSTLVKVEMVKKEEDDN